MSRSSALVTALLTPSLAAAVHTAAPQPPSQGGSKVILVPGDPPLTQETVDHLSRFFEWVLEAPLTTAQSTHLRDGLVEAWQKSDKPVIEGMTQVLQIAAQVEQHPPAERDLLRAQIQPALLAELRKQPDDEGSVWLLGLYESAHRAIAAGDPPLTRQVTDAYAEVLCFLISQVMGRELEASEAFKTPFAQSLAADYAHYDAAGRQELAKMPLYWAAIRVVWPTLSADQQEGYRKQWSPGVAQLVSPLANAAPQPAKAPAGGGELKLESQDAKGYLTRAARYYEQGAWDRVIADCSRAAQLDPKCALAYLTRAKAYGCQFKYQQVIEDASRAIALDPKSWEAFEARGGAYYSAGQAEKANQDLAEMRQLKSAQSSRASVGASTGDARLDALRKLQEHQETMRWVSDMSRLSHETNMAIISNIGGGGWTYGYRY